MKMHESQHIEFKETISNVDGILRTVVAFANNGGGKLYIGIDDNGKIVGASIGRNTIENLAKTITKESEPAILPKIEMEEIEHKTVIVIEVEESKNKPHFYKKIAYKRVGRSNIQMDIHEIKQLILDQSQTRFEDTMVDFDLSDLDSDLFRLFLQDSSRSNRLNVGNEKNILNIMRKLDVVKHNKVKLGFVLMFARNPSKYLSHYGVKFAKISTDHFSIDSLEKSKFYDGPIFRVLDEIVFDIIDALPKRIFLEGIKRVETPYIPKTVVRELITNALIHSNYRVASTISVLLTPSYLEVSNPGHLIDMEIQELYGKHKSILRNPLIAKLMFISGNIEQWGSGIENAIKELLKSDLGLPGFSVKSNFFYVRINFSKKHKERKEALIGLLRKSPKTSRQLAESLSIAERTVRKEIKQLADLGIIQRIRKGRKIYYRL